MNFPATPHLNSPRSSRSSSLKGKTIAFLATDGFEQAELVEPWKAVLAAGGKLT